MAAKLKDVLKQLIGHQLGGRCLHIDRHAQLPLYILTALPLESEEKNCVAERLKEP